MYSGAIAGLADQPLQTLTRDVSGGSSSAGSRATGLVSGVGKGLVGAITKPLGGAAELVSQTSLGLLHSSGLKTNNRQVREAFNTTARDLRNRIARMSR